MAVDVATRRWPTRSTSESSLKAKQYTYLLDRNVEEKGGCKSKYAYFLDHHKEAIDTIGSGHPIFYGDDSPLLRELRTVFDWMAQDRNALRISSRDFKHRLPEIHKKFPLLAANFKRMDLNSDGWLDWEEFLRFCLRDPRLHKMMKRARAITVYGVDATGQRGFKDHTDPIHMSDTGLAPTLLPWESAHVVEWRIDNLTLSRRGSPVIYGGVEIRPGSSIASPPFRAAGICGHLRFYPRGFWTETQKRKKDGQSPGADEAAAGLLEQDTSVWRPAPLPSPSSWCCIGLCAPAGTRLVLRFFVGDQKSEQRDCYWSPNVHASQLWSPPEPQTPASWQPGDPVTVGVEILRNIDENHIGQAVPRCMGQTSRQCRRPLMPEVGRGAAGSVLLGRGRSNSLPQLTRPPSTAAAVASSAVAAAVDRRPATSSF